MASASEQVVVIGAGVAGLAAASQLAGQGLGVTVLEARPSPGGCCGTTDLGGYRLNDGAQFIMLPQLVGLVLEHLGIDPARLPLHRARTPLQTVLADGTQVHLHADRRVEVLAGSVDAGRAQAEIERMLTRWQPLLMVLAGDDWLLKPIRPLDAARRVGRYLPLFTRSLQSELDGLFSDPAFRGVIAGHLLFAGAPAHRFPAPSILALVSVLADGLFVPEGGMGSLPQVLAESVRARGGTITPGAPVDRIIRKPGGGFSVHTGSGRQFDCRWLLSTASPYRTLGRLLLEARLPLSWRRRLARPRLSMKVLSVQLGLRGTVRTLSHLNHHLPLPESMESYFAPEPGAVDWVYASVPSLVAPGLAPAGGGVVELYPAIPQTEPAVAWTADRRERLAESAIEWLRAREPFEVVVRRVRSPLEFESELGLSGGGIYGVDPSAGFPALFPQRTPIEGLYLAGQSCFPGFGVPMAAISGIHAANLILKDLARG
ncbi:MAG: NAD(P)/FAD-dependent oxidoreductase [Chloroflexi bacterium]|nr:NAD(P)/FAD-dependent oxidoreductase [Chloroflexota bacterium]